MQVKTIIIFILGLVIIAVTASNNILAQGVAINEDGSNADASSMLDVKSTSAGMLIPRMTATQRDEITNPAKGLVVFVTSDNAFYYNAGTTDTPDWKKITNEGNTATPGGSSGAVQFNNSGAFAGNSNLFWDNSNNRLGINTDNPSYSLDVNGEAGFESYIRHTGDANTFMYFTPDRWQLETGGRNMIDVQYSDEEVAINECGTQTDFRVEGGSDTHLLFTDGSEDKIGIGTSSPASKLHVYGTDQTSFEIEAAGGSDELNFYMGYNMQSSLNGYNIKYLGSGSGDGNYLQINTMNMGGTPFTHMQFHQSTHQIDVMSQIDMGAYRIENLADPDSDDDAVNRGWVIANDETGTDDQNISGSGLSGTDLTIGIENGSNETVDLSSLDNSGTDDQNLTGASLTGNTLQIDIENGASTSVDLSSVDDQDWEVSGDDIYTGHGGSYPSGNLGIGTTSPSSPLHVDASSHDGTAIVVDRYASGGVASIQAGPSNEYLMLEGHGTTGRVGINFYSSGNVSIANGGGDVGIGTNSPGAQLHTTGSIRFANFSDGFLQVDGSGNVSTGSGSDLFTAGDGLSWSGSTLNSIWKESGDDIYNGNSGNVGIGTNSPDAELHTTGEGRFETTNGIIRLTPTGWRTSTRAQLLIHSKNDNPAELDLRSGAHFGGWHISKRDGEPGALTFYTYTEGDGFNEQIRFDDNGNVGIGTTSPAAQLHTTGSICFANFSDGFLQVDASGNVSTGSGSDLFTAGDGLSWDGNTLNSTWKESGGDIYNGNSGNVGIGTNSPGNKLELVDGTFHIEKSDFGFITMNRPGFGDETDWLISPSSNFFSIFSDDALRIRADGTDTYAFGANGDFGATGSGYFQNNLYVDEKVGIGTTSPSKTLEVDGGLQANNYYAGDGTQGVESASVTVVEDIWVDTWDGTVNNVYYTTMNFKDGLYVSSSKGGDPQLQNSEIGKSNGDLKRKINITDFGSEKMNGNSLWVDFQDEFKKRLGNGVPVITVTAIGDSDVHYYISEKTQEGFMVNCNEPTSGSFDWQAMARVKTKSLEIKVQKK